MNGMNQTWNASDAWLAPLMSSLGSQEANTIYVVFNEPICLSMIKLWNYSKTPTRGAKEVEIWLDDLQIYSGMLREAPNCPGKTKSGKLQQASSFDQPILFTNDAATVSREKRKVLYCGSEEQDVLCINDGQVMAESKAMYRGPDPSATGIVIDINERPTTAAVKQ